MFKKFAIAAPLAAMALSSMAFAAGEANHTVNIKASIPTTVFHVQPRDPNWGRDEAMAYNLANGELAPLSAVYDMRNTNGSITLISMAARQCCSTVMPRKTFH